MICRRGGFILTEAALLLRVKDIQVLIVWIFSQCGHKHKETCQKELATVPGLEGALKVKPKGSYSNLYHLPRERREEKIITALLQSG